MIFVSHDRYFLDALATKLWVLTDGAITVHTGNYSTYHRRNAQAEGAAQPQTPRATAVAPPTRPAHRSVEGVETEIAALEARLAELEHAVTEASAAANVARIAQLGDEYEREKARLDALYHEWQAFAS
jgi:ATP-binding cassette subfamily F protein 3